MYFHHPQPLFCASLEVGSLAVADRKVILSLLLHATSHTEAAAIAHRAGLAAKDS